MCVFAQLNKLKLHATVTARAMGTVLCVCVYMSDASQHNAYIVWSNVLPSIVIDVSDHSWNSNVFSLIL